MATGVQAALGLAIVDESVFALAEQDPGFAKLYFLLESEILTPRYDLHGFSVPDLVTGLPTSDPLLRGRGGRCRARLAGRRGRDRPGVRLQPARPTRTRTRSTAPTSCRPSSSA